MTLLWLGLLLFFAFIAVRCFLSGSYVRGAFAGFAVALFAFSIWIDFQRVGDGQASSRQLASSSAGNPWSKPR